jgi:DNA-binding transcriptional ArsR family regulator
MIDEHEDRVARVAAAISDPTRARILYRLMDGTTQTSTDLSFAANVSPSTTSSHLARLKAARLVRARRKGKYHYYSLADEEVALILEKLSVLVGAVQGQANSPQMPEKLRIARACFDHLAGIVGVLLNDRLKALGLLRCRMNEDESAYTLTPAGENVFRRLGLNLEEIKKSRRKFAYGCFDYSERRSHLAGALGAGVLRVMLQRRWFERDMDSRALTITEVGRRELLARFDLRL